MNQNFRNKILHNYLAIDLSKIICLIPLLRNENIASYIITLKARWSFSGTLRDHRKIDVVFRFFLAAFNFRAISHSLFKETVANYCEEKCPLKCIGEMFDPLIQPRKRLVHIFLWVQHQFRKMIMLQPYPRIQNATLDQHARARYIWSRKNSPTL